MNQCLRAPAVLALAAAVLAGCASQTVQKSVKGETADIAQAAVETGDYSELDPFDHQLMCDSLLTVRQYGEFDRCFDALQPRVDAGEEFTAVMGSQELSPDFLKALLDTLEARRNLELGNYEEAARLAERAAETAQTGDVSRYSDGYVAISTIAMLGIINYSEMYERWSRQELLMPALGTAAVAHELRGKPVEARDAVERLKAALLDLESASDTPRLFVVQAQRHIARYYYVTGDYSMADEWLRRDSRSEAKRMMDEAGKSFSDPFAFAFWGITDSDMQYYRSIDFHMMANRVAFEVGRLDEARAGYDEILSDENTLGYAEVHFAALYDRGRIAVREGNREEAIGFFARAIDALEAQRASIGEDGYKLGFVENRLAVYGDMVLAQISAGRPEAAFEYAERAKARALVDLLADRTSFGGGDRPDRERLRTALTSLKALESRQIQVARAETGNGDTTRGLTIEGIRQEIQTKGGELASLVSVETVSADDIRATLSDQEVLVEYFQSGDRLIAFVVTGRRVEAVDLDGRGLAEAVTAFRRAVQDKTSTDWEPQARALYDRLLGPINDRLNAPLLTVVPQGPLNYLPFAALHDGRGVVADKVAVRVLPSASVLKYLRLRGPAANRALLALGNPDVGDAARDLPGAEVETQAIAARWPSARRLVRANASETLFKENGGTFGYLHVASHGEFDPEDPLGSGLLLAPDAQNDGRLTVSEIYDLELDAELITLSACETALGDLAGGDEVVGLTRGFLYAGARSVVASLWQVSDKATAELMETFYDELKRNSPAEALRRAQLDTKRAYRHPYYWAAFQINGNG